MHFLFSALVAILLVVTGCGDEDIVEIGIIEAFDDPVVDEVRGGFLEAMDESGYRATQEVRYFRFNAEASGVTLDEIVKKLVVEEDVDVLLAIGSDSLKAAMKGAERKPIFFSFAGDSFVGGLTPGEFEHEAIVGGAPVEWASAALVDLAVMIGPPRSIITLLVTPNEMDSVTAAELVGDRVGDSETDLIRVDVADAGGVEEAVRSAVETGTSAILLTPSSVLNDGLGDLFAVARDANIPVLGVTREHVERGAVFALGPVPEENGRAVGELIGKSLTVGANGARQSAETPRGLWISRQMFDQISSDLSAESLKLRDFADVVEVID